MQKCVKIYKKKPNYYSEKMYKIYLHNTILNCKINQIICIVFNSIYAVGIYLKYPQFFVSVMKWTCKRGGFMRRRNIYCLVRRNSLTAAQHARA